MTRILAFIGARGGSKRLEGKNLRTIAGKTLVEITLDQAFQAKLIDKIVFSSEDEEIINNARKKIQELDANKIFIHHRNPNLSLDNTNILEVVKEVNKIYNYDLIVILQVDHPFKTSEMIDKCISLYQNNPEVDDVITFKNNKRTGSIRVLSRETLSSNLPTGHIYLVEDDSNFVDIHTFKDLEKAREKIPSCLICSSKEVVRFKEEGLWKCNNCSVVFQYPQNSFNYDNYDISRINGKDKRINQYKLDILEILRFKDSGRFLDVGCGEGAFLELLPYNFERYGIDIRPSKYFRGNYLTFNFDKKFDIIQMRASLEHFSDPKKFIRKSHKLLKKNGLLVISHLPNIDNYPKMRHLIKPNEHLFYFNPNSISQLLESEDFEILSIQFPYFKTPYEDDKNAKFMNILSVYARKKIAE